MARLIFALLLINFNSLAWAELVKSSPAQQSSVSSAQNCAAVEEGFQNYLVANIEKGHKPLKDAYDCLANAPRNDVNCKNIKQTNLDMLKEYRALYRTINEEAATEWIKTRQGELAKQCFLDSSGKVKFESHIRNLKVQLSDPLMCTGELQAWQSYRENALADYLDGKKSSQSLTKDQMDRLAKMHRSPVMMTINDQAKWNQAATEDELRLGLASAFNNIQDKVKKLRDQVEAYSDKNRHQIYAFDSQLQSYLSTLSEQQQKEMRQCAEGTGFFKDCLSTPTVKGRCFSRLKTLTKELLPIWPVIDGMNNFNLAYAAKAAGVLTDEETIAMQSEAVLTATFGIGGVAGGSAGLAKAAVKKVNAHLSQKSTGLAISSPKLRGIEGQSILARNMSEQVSDPERLNMARSVLGRELTEIQKKAVLEAHYTSDLAKKARLLEEITIKRPDGSLEKVKVGFSVQERRALMENGITGLESQKLKVRTGQYRYNEYGRPIEIIEDYKRPPGYPPEIRDYDLSDHLSELNVRQGAYLSDPSSPTNARLYAGKRVQDAMMKGEDPRTNEEIVALFKKAAENTDRQLTSNVPVPVRNVHDGFEAFTDYAGMLPQNSEQRKQAIAKAAEYLEKYSETDAFRRESENLARVSGTRVTPASLHADNFRIAREFYSSNSNPLARARARAQMEALAEYARQKGWNPDFFRIPN